VKIISGLVRGPFKNEQAFKRAVIRAWEKHDAAHVYFEIENEEKEPGMPDVLAISPSMPARFAEFKYADRNGMIEFTKAQPRFYRRHSGIPIQILAWDCRMGGRTVRIDPAEVVAGKSLRIQLPEDIEDVVEYSPWEGRA
jgi:hypothetical protein